MKLLFRLLPEDSAATRLLSMYTLSNPAARSLSLLLKLS